MKNLIIIPTPIGNLSDLSPNMVQALSDVDVLLCESISNARKLYQHIDQPLPKLIRYWQKTENKVTDSLESLPGENIGLTSDAGMPGISDPGYWICKAWHEKKWPVRVVAGPCAVPMAIAASGIPAENFQFVGFLPTTSEKLQKRLEEIKKSGQASVVYESPRRIVALCQAIEIIFGEDHLVFVAKELTKKHETYYRGSVGSVKETLLSSEPKGEFLMVISRVKCQDNWQPATEVLSAYLSISDCAEAVAKIYSVSRSVVYQFLLQK
jgi:16S rRNA (cytidine1402-2'-O)-methyltransferase